MDLRMTKKNFLAKNKSRMNNQSTTSPSQEKRIVRDMIHQQGQTTLNAIETMTNAIVSKLEDVIKNSNNVKVNNFQPPPPPQSNTTQSK